MERRNLPTRPSASWQWWTVAATVMVAVGCLVLVVDPGGGGQPATAPNPVATSKPSKSSPIARVTPVSVAIDSIDVKSNLLALGLNKDKTVQVPPGNQAKKAGWYRLGTVPGQVGAAVILGHVDSKSGPAVFFDLKKVSPGARVDVRLSDGSTAQFKVTRVKTYDNEAFPAEKVYRGSPGDRALNLVTCGGEYDKAAGGYQSNVVVFSQFVRLA